MSVKNYKIQNPCGHVFIIITFFLGLVIHQSSMAQSQYDLIFVQIPADKDPPLKTNRISSFPDRYTVKSRIVSLSAGSGKPINLTSDFYAACDPAVSFDGNQILFSGKKNIKDRWQLWKMTRDGSGKKRITSSENDCLMPVYAGNRFYLDDPQPTPQIIYTGMLDGPINNSGSQQRSALFGIDTSGNHIHRLTFNPYSDFSPDILSNGRIVFSSWQPLDGGRLALLAVNIDGTDLMPYYGNHEPPQYKEMINISDSNGYVYYIESDTLYWLGGGDIAAVMQNRPLHSYRKIATIVDGIYNTPCTLPDGGLIASYRAKNGGEFALFNIDIGNGQRQKVIYAEAGWHSLDAQVLKAHPRVKGRSNWLIPGTVTGVFYCLNVYQSNLRDAEKIKPGEIKFVRVIEGLPADKLRTEDHLSPQASADTQNDFIPRRVLGTVPVESDGSFQVRVPAEVPVNFQILNENFIKLREQKGWTWVIGNENRGCIGCHEDRELSPPNLLPESVTKPAVNLTVPNEDKRLIDFRHQIWPIINQKCATAKCHVSGSAVPDLEPAVNLKESDGIKSVYSSLLNLIAPAKKISYVIRGSALNSPLISKLLGETPNHTNGNKPVVEQTSHKHLLSHKEKLIFIEWIDLGASWDLSNYNITDSQKN